MRPQKICPLHCNMIVPKLGCWSSLQNSALMFSTADLIYWILLTFAAWESQEESLDISLHKTFFVIMQFCLGDKNLGNHALVTNISVLLQKNIAQHQLCPAVPGNVRKPLVSYLPSVKTCLMITACWNQIWQELGGPITNWNQRFIRSLNRKSGLLWS